MIQGKGGEIAARVTLDTSQLDKDVQRATGKFQKISQSAQQESNRMREALGVSSGRVSVVVQLDEY